MKSEVVADSYDNAFPYRHREDRHEENDDEERGKRHEQKGTICRRELISFHGANRAFVWATAEAMESCTRPEEGRRSGRKLSITLSQRPGNAHGAFASY